MRVFADPARPKFWKYRLLRGVLLLAPFLGCAAPEPRPAAAPAASPPPLTEEQRRRNVESFDYVWTTIRDKHWDATLGGLNWNAVRDELRPQVEAATSMDAARAVFWNLISRLGQSHFAIMPGYIYRDLSRPAAKAKEDAAQPPPAAAAKPDAKPAPADSAAAAKEKEAAPKGEAVAAKEKEEAHSDDGEEEPGDGDPGLDLRIADGRALITRVYEGGAAAQAGVKPGWLLLKIRGEAVAPVLQRILDANKDSGLRDLYAVRSILARLNGNIGTRIPLVFLDGQDKEVEVPLALGRPGSRPIRFGYLPKMYIRFESRMLEGNVGYIAFSGFFDPQRLMPEFERAIHAFMRADGVIIDLRGNPGGIGGMSMGLAGWFVDRPDLQLGVMSMRNMQLKFTISPRPETFNGPVAVLVDGLSASTSEIMAGGLKDIGRARVFGTRTAGAALPSVIERLPNGDGFQYAIANYVSAGGQVLEGRGVVPDQETPPERTALLAGRDPAVAAAVEWIRAQKKSAAARPAHLEVLVQR